MFTRRHLTSYLSHSFRVLHMALNQNHSYKLEYHTPQPASDPLLIFAIVVPIILATVFILIITKCCSNWHQVNPLRWISILRAQQNEDPFIAFSPRMWNFGLDESAIQEIPAFQFTKGEGGGEDQSVYSCVVCLTEFQEQDMLKVLPNCSHAFHLDCIDIWLQTNANCPLCRSSIAGNRHCPMDHIIAPSSSPQDSQLLSNMGSDEDFVVIDLGGEHGGTLPQMRQEVNDSRESLAHSRSHSTRKMAQLKPRKCHHVSIMGDECIDVRKKDDQFSSIQPIRRSFSMDSANDRQVYLDVQAIIQQNRHQNEASASEDCNSRNRRSFFPFRYGRGSKSAVLPLENELSHMFMISRPFFECHLGPGNEGMESAECKEVVALEEAINWRPEHWGDPDKKKEAISSSSMRNTLSGNHHLKFPFASHQSHGYRASAKCKHTAISVDCFLTPTWGSYSSLPLAHQPSICLGITCQDYVTAG